MSEVAIETGIGDSIMIGLNDAVAGWHELFTCERKKRLEQTCQQLRFMQQDIRDVQILYGLLTAGYNEVIQHLLLQAQQFKNIFHVEPTGAFAEGVDIGKRISLFTSGITSVVATGSYLAIGTSRLWSLMGRVSSTPVNAVASGAEVEMVLIQGIARLNAGANVATVASEVTETASTALRVTNMVGKVAFYAGLVAAALQTVLQGIEVANIRNAQKEVESNIQELDTLLKQIKVELLALCGALRATYEGVTKVENGKHVVRLPGAPERDFLLEDFLADIESLTELITQQNATDDKAFQDVRLRLVQNQATLKAVLVPALTQSMTVLATLQDQVRMAFKMLRRKRPLEEVADTVELEPGLLDQLAAYVEQHPQAVTAPNLFMNKQGNLELIDA
jgi:hypothetical protein